MPAIDLLLKPRWIIPVEPDGEVLHEHGIAVHEGCITALPAKNEIAGFEPAEVIELPHHVVLPGLINAHTHSPMTLLRGYADDLPMMEWLQKHIWPAEQSWIGEQFVRDGTLLAAAEMLRGGTTCFSDMYFYPGHTAKACRESGMRAVIGLVVVEFASTWARDAKEYVRKGLEVHDRWKGDPLIRVMLAPHAPYSVSDDTLKHLRVLSDELDMGVHMHVHESMEEIEESARAHGVRPIERLQKLGLLNPYLAAVHMTQLSGADIERCAQFGANVVHCPESNLKLASGYCPVTRLEAAGINVALGTDGAASNNDLDMLGELRSAALLAKGMNGDPRALPAHTALRMATLNGATALGLADEIGSLEPGKAADLIAIDLSNASTLPVYNVLSHVVYCAGRNQVSDVWIAGQRLLENAKLTTIDEPAVLDRARYWGARIRQRKDS